MLKNALVMIIALLVAMPAYSFKLSPTGTALDRYRAYSNSGYYGQMQQWLALRGIHQFTEPVHEEITHRIYDCDADQSVCGKAENDYAPNSVLAGVRWNDDPPLSAQQHELQRVQS